MQQDLIYHSPARSPYCLVVDLTLPCAMKLHLCDLVIVNIFPCACSRTYHHHRPTHTLKLTLLPYLFTLLLFLFRPSHFLFFLSTALFLLSRSQPYTLSNNVLKMAQVRLGSKYSITDFFFLTGRCRKADACRFYWLITDSPSSVGCLHY